VSRIATVMQSHVRAVFETSSNTSTIRLLLPLMCVSFKLSSDTAYDINYPARRASDTSRRRHCRTTCDSQGGGRGRESGRVGKVRNDREQCEQHLSTLYGNMRIYRRPAAVSREPREGQGGSHDYWIFLNFFATPRPIFPLFSEYYEFR